MNTYSSGKTDEKRFFSTSAIILVSIIFILAAGTSLPAEQIILKNGKVINGKIEKQNRYSVTVLDKSGKRQVIRRALIAEIKEDVVEPKKAVEEPTLFPANYSMKLGLKAPVMLPVGDVGSVLGPGFGASVYGNFPLYYINEQLMVTGGFDLGFIYMAGKGDASGVTLNMIPVLLTAGITFRTDVGLSPYVNLGTGITAVLLSGDTTSNDIPSATSVDGTLLVGVGTTYIHPALKGVEFILDVSFIMAFEKVAGSFVTVSAGAAYRFDFGWSGFSSKGSGKKSPAKLDI